MILFVIIFLMTFKPDFLTKQNHFLFREEQQILMELNRIDLKPKSKDKKRQSGDTENFLNFPVAKSKLQIKSQGINKFKDGMAIYDSQIEYFSQICNQNNDEDSLFDSNNKFLEQSKPSAAIISTESNSNKENLEQKTNQTIQIQCSLSQISFQRDFNLQSFFQNLKEHRDLCRKQHEYLQFFQKDLQVKIHSKTNFENNNVVIFKNKQNFENSSRNSINKDNNKSKEQLKYQQSIKTQVIKQEMKIQSQEFKKLSIFEYFVSNQNQVDYYNKEEPNLNQFECTFKPSMLKKSEQIYKSNKQVNQPKQKKQFNLKSQHSKQRIQQLGQPKILKILSSEYCQKVPSFRPSLSKKSIDRMSNSTLNVATRNKLWIEQKQKNIQKIKEQEQQERCKRQIGTYTPSIRKYKKQNEPNFSKFGKQGIINHFQRLSGVNKKLIKSKGEQNLQNKQNKPIMMNQCKVSQISKRLKKQNYSEAVKKLHTRIMSLKI